MKQKRFGKKLELNKKTITDLGSSEMNDARGGLPTGTTCITWDGCPSKSCFAQLSECICPVTKGC